VAKPVSYNADGGDLGRAPARSTTSAQVSPISSVFAIEITKLVEYATTGRERAVENAPNAKVANGMKQFRSFLDKLMQTAGNGVLGTISSFATTTWTMATPPGAALVLRWPDDSSLRLDVDDQPGHGQRDGRGSYQPRRRPSLSM